MNIDAEYLLFDHIEKCNLKDAELIIESGLANINCKNINGFTPLHYSIFHNKEMFIEIFLQFCPDLNTRINFDCGYITPLISAVKNSNFYLTSILIENGANINMTDRQGLSPLHHSCLKKHKGIIKLLLKHSADINQRDMYGFNAKYYANENKDLNNDIELMTVLGNILKITTKDIHDYKTEFNRVHVIVDKRKKKFKK